MSRSRSPPQEAFTSPPFSRTSSCLDNSSNVTSNLCLHQSQNPSRILDTTKDQAVESDGRNITRKVSSSSLTYRKDSCCPNTKGTNMETTASSVKPSQIPLLQDISQYQNPEVSDVTTDNVATTLEELAHLVLLSKYQERKQAESRVRLQRYLVSTALSARLSRCGEQAYRTLVDHFRTDEKKKFASLYNAVHDIRGSCDSARQYSFKGADWNSESISPIHGQDALTSFWQKIPQRHREILLRFLNQIRSIPEFLASRLSSLTPSELSALTVFHQGLESVNSVLPFYSRPKCISSHNSKGISQSPSAVERLLSFQRHDPLSVLIHTCFANSAGPNSLEDVRRTEVWATACARLITEQKSGADSFISHVLNIWTTMRDWPGRSNMEWYLMKILEDGAFLLGNSEDAAEYHPHVEPANIKHSILADEFYSTAVQGLFEVVDNFRAGGIPEGLIELGNAILHKLDTKWHQSTKRFLVSKWLFSVFISNAVIHPESYGMMADYHITEYSRKKILKEVFSRAQKLVVDMLWSPTAASTPLSIKPHIENILLRFRANRNSGPKSKLLPARSITSLRETTEVRPYLVLGPADLVTLVNALFPEKRSSLNAASKDPLPSRSKISSFSTAGTVCGINSASTSISCNTFDNTSVISNSSSSVTSDITTSREPLLDETSKGRENSDEDARFALRIALHEMQQSLGSDGISGACHPCAESWAVLFVSPDGLSLSTQLPNDSDDEADEEELSTSNESEDDMTSIRPGLDKDYHQIRDSILKLVEDYEIPQSLNPRAELKTFSNRTSAMKSPKKRQRNRPLAKNQQQSRNPFKCVPEANSASLKPKPKPNQERECDRIPDRDAPSTLIYMLEAAVTQCQAQSDFVNAHLYWKTLKQLNQLPYPSLKRDGFLSLLSIFSRGPRDLIRRSTSAIEEYDAWLVWLKQSQERHDKTIESMMKKFKALRDKMWYVTDVRNSAAYEGTRNITIALKYMSSLPKLSHTSSASLKARNASRSSTNNFLLKTETQMIDAMAASNDQGGPNKLSDEQSEKTLRWLSQFGIENFCKGEERIHRFCLEVQSCISKLVGENLMDGPVLWSSELFSRDKKLLDCGKQRSDVHGSEIDSSHSSVNCVEESDPLRRNTKNLDLNRTSFRSLRSMSARNLQQQQGNSFNSGLGASRSNAQAAGDLMDSQDCYRAATPSLTIDSSSTFWSPFQASKQTSASSLNSIRTETISSVRDKFFKEAQESRVKQLFLRDLRQTLSGLLISDLGNIIFANGSETDTWFSGEFGKDCFERKECPERKTSRKVTRKRTLDKKKSQRDLRYVHRSDNPLEPQIISGQRAEREISCHSGGSSTSENFHRKFSSKDMDCPEFPYRKAFRHLLKMFSVHPNPYAKLDSIFELEQLIIAFLTPTASRRSRIRPETLNAIPSSPEVQHINAFGNTNILSHTPRAKNLEEAIDNCRERRSNALYQNEKFTPSYKVSEFSPSQAGPASTDMIVEVLQSLFRDSDMRPKTLFRDLQFIATFVPATTLDKTERGKAFWDAGLAALGLKQDVCRTLIEIADEIVAQHTQTRSTTISTPSELNLTLPNKRYNMRDAAKMWTITAKEGDPVAERELAIFYLTHPQLVERVTAPLSKPRETFKAQVMNTHANSGKEERNDPATMCVAYHWMELSALGGDELAKKYLRQREELNDLP